MTIEELRAHCEKQQMLRSSVITIVLPRNGKGQHRRIARGGPLGRIVGQQPGQDVVMFQIDEMINWLNRG